jgi:hypothetical protein
MSEILSVDRVRKVDRRRRDNSSVAVAIPDEFRCDEPSYAYMIAPRPRKIVCDVGALAADARTLDALARLQLSARRAGLDLRLSHASGDLRALLAFAGLSDVLRVEAGGQTEKREHRVGVEEERHLDDPAC